MEKHIIIYDSQGYFVGLYDDIDIVNTIIQNNENYKYNYVTDEFYQDFMNKQYSYNEPIFNVSNITDSDIFDINCEYLIEQKKEINIDYIKNGLIKSIKQTCQSYIIKGCFVTLSNGEKKEFSFKIEDQINLKAFIDMYNENDSIYYHSNNEIDELFSYNDITLIYKTLFNNKLYNLIYTQVLCDWINNNYTEEMFKDKDIIIAYGYSNDSINTEVGEKYEQQKLS